jgi:hypothetical protein
VSRSSSKLLAVPAGASQDYVELLVLVRRYVSNIMAESTLEQALGACDRTAATFRRQDAERVIERAMVGMRLFCVSAKLPYLMIALAEYCEGTGTTCNTTSVKPATS